MSSVAVETSAMDHFSLIFSLKCNSDSYHKTITKLFETNQEMSLKSSGNNGFGAEDTNDNITGIGNHN